MALSFVHTGLGPMHQFIQQTITFGYLGNKSVRRAHVLLRGNPVTGLLGT